MMKILFWIAALVCCITGYSQQRRNTRPADVKLCCDQVIAINQQIESNNGNFFLVFQGDRNLVLYMKTSDGDKALWSTATNNKADRAVMQYDGNFVVYNGSAISWSSNTSGNRNATLTLQDDGNLVIKSSDRRVLWSSNTSQIQPAPSAPVIAEASLCCDKAMAVNQRIETSNGKFFLTLQGDRNLVLYMKTDRGDKALWSSATTNKADRAVMQANGNFVLYKGLMATWSSNTNGNPNAMLVLQEDGNLVIRSSDRRVLWSSNTAQIISPQPQPEAVPQFKPAEPVALANTMCCEKRLSIEERITSPNGKFFLVLQGDRNLVLYMNAANGTKALWATGTNNRADRAVMQEDGNFVVYIGKAPTWASNTNGNRNAILTVQNDGNLVIRSASGNVLWQTGTAQWKESEAVEEVVEPAVTQPVVVEPVVTQQPVVEQQPVTTAAPVSVGCAMSDDSYNNAVKTINGQAFRDAKMKMAKQAIKGKCLSLNQVRSLTALFSFEDQKLEFLKYAYDFTESKSEYYTLVDIFSFNSSVKSFTAFLDTK